MSENKNTNLRLRIKLKTGEEFEAEGDFDFINEQKQEFLQLSGVTRAKTTPKLSKIQQSINNTTLEDLGYNNNETNHSLDFEQKQKVKLQNFYIPPQQPQNMSDNDALNNPHQGRYSNQNSNMYRKGQDNIQNSTPNNTIEDNLPNGQQPTAQVNYTDKREETPSDNDYRGQTNNQQSNYTEILHKTVAGHPYASATPNQQNQNTDHNQPTTPNNTNYWARTFAPGSNIKAIHKTIRQPAIKGPQQPILLPNQAVWDRIALYNGTEVVLRQKDKNISTMAAALIILGAAKVLREISAMTALELAKCLKLSGYLKDGERLDRAIAKEVKEASLLFEGSKRNRSYSITQKGLAKAFTIAERTLNY